jgi:hypothetical protein
MVRDIIQDIIQLRTVASPTDDLSASLAEEAEPQEPGQSYVLAFEKANSLETDVTSMLLALQEHQRGHGECLQTANNESEPFSNDFRTVFPAPRLSLGKQRKCSR